MKNSEQLTENEARTILNTLATRYNEKIHFTKHVRERMKERDITTRQIFNLFGNSKLIFTEGPYQNAKGNWVFNVKANIAGEAITVTIE